MNPRAGNGRRKATTFGDLANHGSWPITATVANGATAAERRRAKVDGGAGGGRVGRDADARATIVSRDEASHCLSYVMNWLATLARLLDYDCCGHFCHGRECFGLGALLPAEVNTARHAAVEAHHRLE